MAFGYQPRAIPSRGVRPKTWTVAGVRGMFDAKAKGSERRDIATLLINLAAGDSLRGGHVVLRTGRQRHSTPTTDQLGSAALRRAQCIEWGYRTTSLEIVTWVDGECWTMTGTALTLTKVIDAATLSAASITLNASNPIYAVVFNGKWIFAQNGTRPFSWDGTTLGGLASLTNAPSNTYGPPAVYYAKLFFIFFDQITIGWSEENQENVGYASGGYNNAWELTQTDRSPLFVLAGSNEGLYYGRANGVGVIRGAVSTTFTNDGVHDSVSPNVGVSIGTNVAMRYLNGTLYWYSGAQTLWAYRPGTGAVQLSLQLPREFAQHLVPGSSPRDVSDLWGVGEELTRTIIFNGIQHDSSADEVYFNGIGASLTTRVSIVFDAASLQCRRIETHPVTNQFALVNIAPLGSDSTCGEIILDQGYLFVRLLRGGTAWIGYYDEAPDGTGTPVTGTLLGPMHGWDTATEWAFDQIDVVVGEQPTTLVTAGYLTSRVQSYGSTTPLSVSKANTMSPYEHVYRFGLAQNARWMRPVLRVTAGAPNTRDRPELHGYALTAYPVGRTVGGR